MPKIKGNDLRIKTITSVNEFACLVAKREGKKKEMSIAQILEVLRIVRTLLKRAGVDIYTVIGSTDKDRFV